MDSHSALLHWILVLRPIQRRAIDRSIFRESVMRHRVSQQRERGATVMNPLGITVYIAVALDRHECHAMCTTGHHSMRNDCSYPKTNNLVTDTSQQRDTESTSVHPVDDAVWPCSPYHSPLLHWNLHNRPSLNARKQELSGEHRSCSFALHNSEKKGLGQICQLLGISILGLARRSRAMAEQNNDCRSCRSAQEQHPCMLH